LHYKLRSGILRPGDPADFILINNTADFKVLRTYIDGECVAENGVSVLPPAVHTPVNNFHAWSLHADDFKIPAESSFVRAIEVYDGQLITGEMQVAVENNAGNASPDPSRDLLKIAVVNRYAKSKPAVAFIKNFGLKRGAIASSVAHDSHNIIVVGADDESIAKAANLLMEHTGGLSLVDGTEEITIALPIAGLMSDRDCATIGKAYAAIDKKAKELGSTLRAPYMSLSFMALLVIPQLKLSDKGLFDGKDFRFVPLFL
jgi:adenine deaminase